MNRSLASAQSFQRLSVASANLLIETNTAKDRHMRVEPQHARTSRHIDSFRAIETRLNRPIDMLGMQELQITDDHHNGDTIRSAMNMPFGAYAAHSRKPAGEHIGIVGRRPDSHDFITLGKNRKAPIVRLGEVCVMFVHMSYTDTVRRKHEYETLLEFAAEEENLILGGDFNEEALFFSSRYKLGQVGLRSAFVLDKHHRPLTLPAPGYGQLRPLSRRIGYGLVGGGLQFDDIYVKGELRTNKTGIIESASDHRFVYADFIGPSGIFDSSAS